MLLEWLLVLDWVVDCSRDLSEESAAYFSRSPRQKEAVTYEIPQQDPGRSHGLDSSRALTFWSARSLHDGDFLPHRFESL